MRLKKVKGRRGAMPGPRPKNNKRVGPRPNHTKQQKQPLKPSPPRFNPFMRKPPNPKKTTGTRKPEKPPMKPAMPKELPEPRKHLPNRLETRQGELSLEPRRSLRMLHDVRDPLDTIDERQSQEVESYDDPQAPRFYYKKRSHSRYHYGGDPPYNIAPPDYYYHQPLFCGCF